MQCIALHSIARQELLVKLYSGGADCSSGGRWLAMKKDTQFTFRIPMDLKRELQRVATEEGRSMAQICEAFLRAGSEGYKKEGSKFLRRFLGRQTLPS